MRKKEILLGIVLLCVLWVSIGLSYAAWTINLEQVGENKIKSTCFSLSLTNEKNEINLGNTYPIIDEEGKKLTPYSFTITNTCDLFASYEVTLEVLEGSTMSSNYIATMVNKEQIETLGSRESRTPTIQGSTESRLLANGSLGSGDSVDYTLRLWMDEEVTLENTDSMNAILKSKIVVTASPSTYSPKEYGITKLSDAILANEYQTTPEIAKEKISKKQTPDFTKIAPLIDWQESHGSTATTVNVIMPRPELVGSTDPRYAQLTETNVYPGFGTSYTFDKETGRYTLNDMIYQDPTTITDYGTKDYYFCSAGTNTNLSDLVQPYANTSCTIMYRVTNVAFTESTMTGSGGSSISIRKYKITGYQYNQVELESDKSEKGLYQMLDNGKTIYYYRGSVKNNYVKFGGYYWRILRTNQDGSIRLLYAGTNGNATGNDLHMKLTDNTLGYTNRTTSVFNTLRNNPGYAGYMYGNTLNSTYEETNANENDSMIKKYLDSWYKQNIVDVGLESYIEDAGFCNDRSLSSQANNGNGTQTDNDTFYGGNERYLRTKVPKLECPNQNDLFTTATSSIGNQILTYPIGLITVDELMMSGLADGYLNRLSYTYSNQNYWTMSPSRYYASDTAMNGFILHSDGYASGWGWVTNDYGVRGVINLKSDVEISGGIGTSNDPYVVKTT